MAPLRRYTNLATTENYVGGRVADDAHPEGSRQLTGCRPTTQRLEPNGFDCAERSGSQLHKDEDTPGGRGDLVGSRATVLSLLLASGG